MKLDHIAIKVKNIKKGINWYKEKFVLDILYEDDTWAMLKVHNPVMKIALVIEEEHPNHIGISCNELPFFAEKGKFHRDGSEYHYESDPWGNTWEWVKYPFKHWIACSQRFDNEPIGCTNSTSAEEAEEYMLQEKERGLYSFIEVDPDNCPICKEFEK